MKRFLSFVLAVLMVFSMSVSIIATDTETPAITPDTVGADGINEDTVITLYDEPVVTTVGTKANLLAGLPKNDAGKQIYTAKTDGARGLAFIFKVEGSEPGTIIGKFDMNVTARRITAVDAETGEKTYSAPETKGPIHNGNWCNVDAYNCNSYVLDGDGYYIYWFPFKTIENTWTNVETIAGETTLNSAYIFNQTGALGNARAGKIVPDADIKVSCLGIIEGSIDTYDVIAYNKQTDAYEAKASGVSLNALSGGYNAQWSKVSTPDELFGKFYGAGEGEYVSSWTDRDGNEIDGSLESLLGTKVVKPVYTSYTEEEIIKLTFVDAEGKSLGDVVYLNAGILLEGEIPAAPAKAGDGVVTYVFEGWSIDGENIIDVTGTAYDGDTTLKPVYTAYGAVFTDNEPIALPKTEDIAPIDILPVDSVAIGGLVPGITLVYEVEGADKDIIADDFLVHRNGENSNPAWAWADLINSADGSENAANLTLKNGYFYLFLNRWVIANGSAINSINSAYIFNNNGEHWDSKDPERVATNENDDATIRLLALANGNLQPTVNYYVGDELYASYQQKYTDLSFSSSGRSNNIVKGELLSADDIFALTELAAPEKKADSNGVYTFKGWVDAEGNPVDGVYANMDVYADYDVKEAIIFADENGDAIGVFEIVDGGLAEDAVIPEAPAKAGDGIITYAFAGWTVDGETIVDPATYEYTGSVVFKPLYNQYGAYLDGEAVVLPKVSTEVSETSETVDNDDGSSVTTTVTTYVTTATYADGTTVTSTRVVTTKVTTGADGKTKTEVSGTDENKIALNILTEEVATDPLSTGITLVYKVEGADTEIIADNAWMTTTRGGPSWHWKFANKLTLNNGYYYLHLNDGVNGLNTVKDPAMSILTSFSLFRGFDKNCASDGRPATNANENASIQILAVTDNNIAPTAVFHDADGNVLAEYTNTYFTKLGASAFHAGAVKTGALLSIAEVQTLAAVETPVKAPTHDGRVTYEFAGWVDADGNAVDAFYYNVDLYPSFKIASDARPEYTVKFVDEDGTELYSVKVREDDVPVYEGEEPAKAADKKNTYVFAGWDAEIVAATADATYKATYTATAIEYTVTFMNGDDELAKETTTYEGAVTAPEAPVKENTAEFTYAFDKWVDAEGNAVDLNKITDNITVYTKYSETVNKYTVTFVNDDGTVIEKVTVNYGTAATAPEAKKDATDEYTYTFDKWVDAEGNEADFSKVVADITVKATYTATKNEVTVTFMNGDAEFEKVTVTYGTEAKATADPTKETANFTKYTFAGWVDAEGNKVDLTKVEADVTVYASYTTECEHSFDDIKKGEWYEAAVEWALMNGIMNGEGAKFNPNKATSRAMIVTVLYRIEGSPDVSEVEHPFTDIEEGDWYYDAVKWAYSEGVVNGNSATTYAPDATLTREQFATILYRYAKEIKGEDVSVDEGANLDAYTDKDEVSGYALDAVLWTNVNGYIGGTSATKLSPKGSATRAQMATILYRYITAE